MHCTFLFRGLIVCSPLLLAAGTSTVPLSPPPTRLPELHIILEPLGATGWSFLQHSFGSVDTTLGRFPQPGASGVAMGNKLICSAAQIVAKWALRLPACSSLFVAIHREQIKSQCAIYNLKKSYYCGWLEASKEKRIRE